MYQYIFAFLLLFGFGILNYIKLRSCLHENEKVYCVVCDNLTFIILHGIMMAV